VESERHDGIRPFGLSWDVEMPYSTFLFAMGRFDPPSSKKKTMTATPEFNRAKQIASGMQKK
jgi:hypothetical protein